MRYVLETSGSESDVVESALKISEMVDGFCVGQSVSICSGEIVKGGVCGRIHKQEREMWLIV